MATSSLLPTRGQQLVRRFFLILKWPRNSPGPAYDLESALCTSVHTELLGGRPTPAPARASRFSGTRALQRAGTSPVF